MTKTVFSPSSQVYHVWNSQTQQYGKNSKDSCSFSGRTAYSYAAEIGFINADGCAVLSSGKWTVTTSSHQSDVRGATRNRTQYFVPDLSSLTTYLEQLNRGNRDKDSEYISAGRNGLSRYLAKHILELDSRAGVYLCDLIKGEKKGGSYFASERRKAERARDKGVAQLAADTFANELRSARNYAANFAKAKTYAGFVALMFEQRDSYSHKSDIKRHISGSYHAHKAAKKRGWSQVTRDVWELQKILRRYLAAIETREAIRDRNRHFRGAIAEVKRKAASPAMVADSYYFQRYQTDCDTLLRRWPTLLPSVRVLRESAAALCAAISADNAAKAEAKRRADIVKRAEASAAAFKAWQEGTGRRPYSWDYLPESAEYAAIMASEADEREAQRLRAVADAEERQRKQREALPDWLSGKYVPGFHATDSNGGAYIRATDSELQTSLGAAVPLRHAVRVFQFVKAVREQHEIDWNRPSAVAWRRNGQTVRVGHFQVDEVYADGSFKAGCHRINWPEIERLAKTLGVFDVAADSSVAESSH